MSDKEESARLFGPLFPQPNPPATLEARVEKSLIAAGLLRGGRGRRDWRAPLMLALAVGVVCFAAGFVVGAARHTLDGPKASQHTPRFALLLYGAPVGQPSPSDVEEHERWAARLATEGHSIYGEKLVSGEVSLLPSRAGANPINLPDAALQGFFVISARSEAEAVEVARSSPHYRHGGRIVVRRIEPTKSLDIACCVDGRLSRHSVGEVSGGIPQ